MPPAMPRLGSREGPLTSPPPAADADGVPSFISALRELENPVNHDVLNLAATLGTPPDDHDPPARDSSARRNDGSRDRLRRVMSRLSQLNESAAYGDRVPRQNSLYDWSPSHEHDLDQLLAAREHIPSRLQGSPAAAAESLRSTAILQSVRRHPRFSARTREYLQRYHHDRDASSRPPPAEQSSRFGSEGARLSAIQQRLSEYRSAPERERQGVLSRTDPAYRRSYLDRTSSAPVPPSPLLEETVKYLSRIRYADAIDDSLSAALEAGLLRKEHDGIHYGDFITDTFCIPPPAETSWLTPGAVLSGCQHATNAVVGFVRGASSSEVDSQASPPSPGRSWSSATHTSPRHRPSWLTSDGTPQTSPPADRWPVNVTIHEVDWDRMSLAATMEAYNVPSHPHSHPSYISNADGYYPPQYTRTSSITTYLEGEILDFNTHTLLTESFPSNAINDATYWRKLPPFQQLSDEEVARALTSQKWFEETLSQEWVLMRWKERCFVKALNRSTNGSVQPVNSSISILPDVPASYHRSHNTSHAEHVYIDPDHASFDDSGCGLTISGFYYVCLRRSDGHVEGLYFDPQSSPYQCLKLESVARGIVPAWEFR